MTRKVPRRWWAGPMSDFAVAELGVLVTPLAMIAGATVLASFGIDGRGFRLDDCRLYYVPDKCWGLWTSHPSLRLLSDLRCLEKAAARNAYETLRAS